MVEASEVAAVLAAWCRGSVNAEDAKDRATLSAELSDRVVGLCSVTEWAALTAPFTPQPADDERKAKLYGLSVWYLGDRRPMSTAPESWLLDMGTRESLTGDSVSEQIREWREGEAQGRLLVVEGDLTCHLPNLRKLPPGLAVINGDLDLRGCGVLEEVDDTLFVGGHLFLCDCFYLQRIGAVTVGGAMGGDRLDRLEIVDGNAKVFSRLVLKSAIFQELPDTLEINDELCLRRCSNLIAVPNCVRNLKELDVTGCSRLKSLPDNMCLGRLVLDTTAVEELPKNLRVGYLFVRRSPIEELPDGLETRMDVPRDDHMYGFRPGSIAIVECNSFKFSRLPQGLRIDGELGIFQCPIQGLPEGLCVDRLSISSCPNIATLPNNINVGGSIVLFDLSGFTSLPDNFSVHGTLRLVSCQGLRSLPADLQVSGDLDLDNCTNLSSLPSTFLEWGPTQDGTPHILHICGVGLSNETREWLQSLSLPGIQFMYHMPTSIHAPPFESLEAAVEFWSQEAKVSPDVLEGLTLASHEKRAVLEFLSRLKGAKEFGLSESRLVLAKRVLDVLETMHNDSMSRVDIVQRMEDSLDACDDKPIWALNQMMVAVLTSQARGDRDALRSLGKRIMKLAVVHEEAQRIVARYERVDDVCVYLKLEIELRDELDLPLAATSMHFPTYVQIGEDDLENIRDRALGITDSEVDRWLEGWTEWQRQLRSEQASELEWSSLPVARRSLSRRVSRRLSLRNLFGSRMVDPVQVGQSVWSLSDLLRHWIRTGLDLNNSRMEIEDIKRI